MSADNFQDVPSGEILLAGAVGLALRPAGDCPAKFIAESDQLLASFAVLMFFGGDGSTPLLRVGVAHDQMERLCRDYLAMRAGTNLETS